MKLKEARQLLGTFYELEGDEQHAFFNRHIWPEILKCAEGDRKFLLQMIRVMKERKANG